MELLSFFSIIKYGAKIFLAVMGFISFEDINVKPVNNLAAHRSSMENVSYVESLPVSQEKLLASTYYTDHSYFVSPEKNTNNLFTFKSDYAAELEFKSLNPMSENNVTVFEKIIFLENDNIEDFEVLVLQENVDSEVKYCIRIFEEKVNTNISNRLSSISFSQSID